MYLVKRNDGLYLEALDGSSWTSCRRCAARGTMGEARAVARKLGAYTVKLRTPIRRALGLPATATVNDIIEAIETLKLFRELVNT